MLGMYSLLLGDVFLGDSLWRSCSSLSIPMPSNVWIAFGWFGIVASGVSCPLISISSWSFCWLLPILLCYQFALVWVVICVPWTLGRVLLVPLLGNLCRAHQLWLQPPTTSLLWLFAILWRPCHCWVESLHCWTWKKAIQLCVVCCFQIGMMRCCACALLGPCCLQVMSQLRPDGLLHSRGTARSSSLYFLLGLLVVRQVFTVLVALRCPHILRSIGTSHWFLGRMCFPLCSMVQMCLGILRIGKFHRRLAWHVDMVGVVAFVRLCAGIALTLQEHTST